MGSSYEILVDKLKSYYKRYIFLKLITGLCIFLSGLICYILAIYTIEFSFYTSSLSRLFFLLFFAVVFIGLFYFFVLEPLATIIGIRRVSLEKQARLVSKHFPDLRDYLINIIELHDQNDSNSLVISSIEQKIGTLNSFSFKQYFRIRLIIKELVAVCFAFLLAFCLVFFFPALVREVGYRVVHFNQQFLRPAPFQFNLKNESLTVAKGDNLTVEVVCRGAEVPGNVYINIGGKDFIMDKTDSVYSYELEHIQNSFDIFFTDLKYVSEKYPITVIPEPVVLGFSVSVSPPFYTRLKGEQLENQGSFSAPFGSKVKWTFKCGDTDSLSLLVDGKELRSVKEGGSFIVESTVLSDFKYRVLLTNRFKPNKEAVSYDVKVIPDLFPEIQVVALQDSVQFSQFYFKGMIGDDFGFHDLILNLKGSDSDTIFKLDVSPNMLTQEFYYIIDFKNYSKFGNYFNYYFTVKDNDYLHGFKQANSETFSFQLPNKEQFGIQDRQQYGQLQKTMIEAQRMAEELKESVDQLRYKSLSENLSDWEKQQMLKGIQQKRENLQESLRQLSIQNKQRNSLNNSFGSDPDELLQKQKQVEELMNELMNDELRNLFDELNKLVDEFDQEKLNQLMEKFSFPMESLSEQLDRNLEMLKRLKIEQSLERVVSELNELAGKEDANGEEFSRGTDYKDLEEKETENANRLDSLKSDMDEVFKLNEELDEKMKMFPVDNEFNEIKDSFKQLFENVERKNKSKTLKDLKRNSELVKNLAFSVQQMIDGNASQQMTEDISNLKQILKNLIYVSLRQEDVLNLTNGLSVIDPMINPVLRQQDLVINQTKQLKDSLYALAKRTPAISSKVTDEFSTIDYSNRETVSALKEGFFDIGLKYQQTAVTSYNELALLLNEALENLERAQANAKPGNQQCEKPGGGGSGSMQKLKDAQQSLKDQMQRMIEELKSGKNGNIGKEIGKTLLQQDMMKKAIQDLMTGSDVGSSAKEQLKAIEQIIEQNRVDLIQKNITNNLVVRQNQILDKLLKAEKSEFERELDDKRESNSAEQIFYSNPESFFEYKKSEKNKEEDIRYFNLHLRSYYEQKYRDYLNQINQ